MKRKYISVEYDYLTQKVLTRWCLENGFDLGEDPDNFNFHTTIFYSSNKTNVISYETSLPAMKVECIGFDVLDTDNKVPVIKIRSKTLSQTYLYYELLGLKSDFPIYTPHITLSYSSKFPDLNILTLPEFSLYYDKLIVKDITE